MKRTPFGTMLNNFRFQKRMAIDKTKREMQTKAGLDHPKYGEEFEFRESTVHAQDGSTVTRVELWRRIDVERVKISTSVLAEKIEDDVKVEEQKDDDDWGI